MNFKDKRIIFMDFDTIFSSYIRTNTLKYNLSDFSDIRIFLPQIEDLEFIFKEVLNTLSCDSILVLDSLNGLTDSLNMFNLSKINAQKKNNKINAWNKTSSRFKFTGYQSLNILFLLLKKAENNKIPIIVTVYQSTEKSKKMVYEILSNKGVETNHYIRISNMVLFLEFIEEDCKTGFTIMKKNYQSIFAGDANANLPSSFDKKSKVFYPYSRWYYYDFFNL